MILLYTDIMYKCLVNFQHGKISTVNHLFVTLVFLHTVALFFSLTDEKTYACIIADNERPELAAALEVSALTYCWLQLQREGCFLLLYR